MKGFSAPASSHLRKRGPLPPGREPGVCRRFDKVLASGSHGGQPLHGSLPEAASLQKGLQLRPAPSRGGETERSPRGTVRSHLGSRMTQGCAASATGAWGPGSLAEPSPALGEAGPQLTPSRAQPRRRSGVEQRTRAPEASGPAAQPAAGGRPHRMASKRSLLKSQVSSLVTTTATCSTPRLRASCRVVGRTWRRAPAG